MQLENIRGDSFNDFIQYFLAGVYRNSNSFGAFPNMITQFCSLSGFNVSRAFIEKYKAEALADTFNLKDDAKEHFLNVHQESLDLYKEKKIHKFATRIVTNFINKPH